HPSASSEGWHVQWESIPSGQESEPCNLGRIREGNEADQADRQRALETGPCIRSRRQRSTLPRWRFLDAAVQNSWASMMARVRFYYFGRQLHYLPYPVNTRTG